MNKKKKRKKRKREKKKRKKEKRKKQKTILYYKILIIFSFKWNFREEYFTSSFLEEYSIVVF
jgi:hypothetical protein